MKARKIAQDELNKSLAEQSAQLTKDEECLRSLEEAIKSGASVEKALATEMDGASASAKEHAIATKGAAGSTEVFVDKQKQAQTELRATAEASKGAGIAMKALAMAGSMIASWAIGAVISLVVKGIDNLIHAEERCKERAENLISTYKTAIDTANSHKQSVEDISSRYEELSKGVNNLGENVSLTADEYSEYNSIVNDIAEMFPTMVQGYTDEGNAILKLKGNVDALREAYEAEAQAAYNSLITTGKDSDGNDILKDANNIISGSTLGSHDWGNVEKIKYLDKIINATSSADDMLDLFKNSQQSGYIKWFREFTGVDGSDFVSKLKPEELANIRKNANVLKQEFQAEINSAVDNAELLANAYLMTNEDYEKLDEQSKNAASIMVNSLNAGIVAGFGEDKQKVGTYVQDIIDIIKDNPEANEAMIDLFTMDTSKMSVNEIQSEIEDNIETISEILKEDPIELKARLGFDDSSTQPLINKVQGFLKDDFDNKVGELTLEELDAASKLEIPKGTLLSWDELIAKIREVEEESDLSPLTSSVTSFTTAQEALNTALSEQNSTGTISSETLATLKDNFENIDDAIELTTKGIIINTDKLNELNKSQKDLIGNQLDEAEEKLTKEFNDNSNELAILSERLANNTDLTNYQRQVIEQEISALEKEQVATRGQIAELRNLQLEYENSISTHSRFINALSSEDAGSGYDAVTSGLEQVEKEWNAGNIGKDEIRNFVDYMTYDDMSSASIDEITASYERAMQMAKMYFTESSEGSRKFLELLEEHKLATNTDGMWDIDIDDLDAAAKEIGVSTDFLIDNLDKLKDKGFSVEYLDNDGLDDKQTKLKEIDSQIESINKTIASGVDESLFEADLNELKKLRQEVLDGITFESLDSELDTINTKLKSLYAQMDRGGGTPEILEEIKYWEGKKVNIELLIESGKAEEEILLLQEKIDNISHYGSAAVVDQLTAPLKQQQQELAQKYNIDLEAVISSNIDEQTNELQETVENLDLSTEIDVSANTKKAKKQIEDIVNRDYRAKVELEVNDTNFRLKIAQIIDKALEKHEQSNGGSGGTSNNETPVTPKVNGSANVFGSAYAKGKRGNWKTGVTGKSLVGELGQEILVRDGTFRTIGDNGAELIDIKKDDIIFNHLQTEQILKHGKVTSRGKSFLHGSAFSGLKDKLKRYKTGVDGNGRDIPADNTNTNSNNGGNKNSSSTSTSDDAKATETLFDYIEILLERLEKTADKMKEMIEKAVDFVAKQYQTIRAINSTNQAIRYNHIASQRYARFAEQRAIKANNDTSIEGSTVSDERLQEYMRLIREGKIGGTDIEAITNERLRTALEEYQSWYEKAKACQEEVENLNDTIIELYDTLANNPIEKAADAIDKLSTKMDLLDAKLKNIFTTPTYNNKKVNSVYTGNYEKVAQDIINNYNKQTEELKKASDTANANYTKSVTDLNTKRQSAYSMVSKYGSSAGLTAQQLKNVQNYIKAGKVIPDDYMKLITNQGLYNYLLQYNQAVIAKQEYAEAKTQANADYNQAKEENATAIREVQKDVFDNIEKAYQNQIDRLSAAEEALSAQVSLLEAKGMVVDSKYYSKQIEYEKNKLKYYENEKKALEEQIKNIAQGSDEWYEAKATLEELNEQLINSNTTIAEMNNSITELANNLQSKLLDRLTRVSDEMSFITGLMENRELINEGSGFTDEGLATLGAYVSGLNTAQIQANSMKQLFESMQKNYSKGKLEFIDSNGVKRSYNSLEQFKEAIDETYTSWQEQIKSVYDFQNDIIDMMTEKYQKELEALKELIEAKKESLQAEKDLRSYQQDVQSSMDNIGSLQKQIQALQGDNSEEGNMRIQKLQKQLEDAQKDLEDKEYDKYISDQEEMLDKMVSEYEDFLNSELKNIEWLLQQGIQVAQQSMDTIENTIEQYAGSYKYDTDSYNLITGLDNINLTEQEIKSLLSEIRDSLKADDTTTSSNSSSNKTNSDKSSNKKQTTNPQDKSKDLEDVFKDLKVEIIAEVHDKDDKYFTKITDKEPTVKTVDISKMGFAKGGIGKLIKASGEDGIAFVKNGEGFVDPEDVKEIQNLLSVLPNLNNVVKPLVTTDLLNNIKSVSNSQPNNIEATFEFNLPNVTDSDSFLRVIKTDKRVQRAMQDLTIGQINGSTSKLGVNKY